MRSWHPISIARRSAVLDFRSSGRGLVEVTQLVADGEMLANAVHLTSWAARESQAIVCASCGVEGCELGGWVSVRRAGDFVLWLPAIREGPSSPERAPRRYVTDRGLVVLAVGSPGPCADGGWSEFLPLTRRELALAMRWSAPEPLVGPAGLRVDDVAWMSSGTPVERGAQLDALLTEALADESPTAPRAPRSDDERIEIHAHAPIEPWSPLVMVAGRPRLSLAGLVEARDRPKIAESSD